MSYKAAEVISLKHNMILKHQIQHSSMIAKALSLCETMLSRSETLYPFAVVSIEKELTCIFLEDEDCSKQHPNGVHFGMIEKLEKQIAWLKKQSESTIGLLVYAATITSPELQESDALMFSMCDADGENTLTLYPYELQLNSIQIGKPFTCDFSD